MQKDAVRPDVDVAPRREIALRPIGMIVLPAVLQAADGARRQTRRILAEKCCQRFREIAGRNALEVEDRQQRLDRLGAAHVERQDRRSEADAARIVSGRPAITQAGLLDWDRTDTGYHFALGPVPVADDACAAILGLALGMLDKEAGDLGLDRLREQGTGPIAQDFRELVVEGSWLNQSDDVIVGPGISAPSVEK